MRYLVTGGAGFIGSHLVERLIARNAEVVVLDDFSSGRRENLDALSGDFELVEGTLLQPETCARAVRGVDYVLHQGAIPSVPRSVKNPIATHDACATGTLNMLVAARDAKVRRFVYAASSSAYGNTKELPKHEEMLSRPLSPYAVAKYAGECYCRAFFATYGLSTVALRYFNIFGPRQDPASQYAAAIAKFISCALNGTAPVIYGDGEQTRDFTYVANAVDANLLACEAGDGASGDVFNVGCGDRISVNDLWRRIQVATGATIAPTYVAAREGDVRDSLASLEKIRRVLGYEPVVQLDTGLSETINYFRR